MPSIPVLPKTESWKLMIKEFFDKARANLSAAQLCYDNDLFDASANRAYYAAFQAAVAALAHKGIKRKDRLDHEWVQAQFNGRLIRRDKLFPGKIRSYLPDIQAIRNIADYRNDSVSKKETARQLAKAKEFILLISKEIDYEL